jgi:hypothetical protein
MRGGGVPYKSAAQRAKFHADPKLRKYAPEWDAASRGKRLPARAAKPDPKPVSKKKRRGGRR